MRNKCLISFFMVGLLVSCQRTHPIDKFGRKTCIVTGGLGLCGLGIYGLYKLYNHLHDFNLKDAEKLLEKIEKFESASAYIITTDTNSIIPLSTSEPRVCHVVRLREAIYNCEGYAQQIQAALPFLEKKQSKQQDSCLYEAMINKMREKIDELGNLKIKMQGVAVQIEQSSGYDQEYSRYELKELRERVKHIDTRLWRIEDDIRILKNNMQRLNGGASYPSTF